MSHAPQVTFRAVTVYCSSSNDLHQDYFAEAESFGRRLAESGRELVYGGGCVGSMGRVARACREAGGRVIGIITERLRDAEQLDPDNHENIVVATMRQRKALLESRGDAIVVLPGGLGTLEEFFEILVGRLLGEHDKPIILVNSADPDDPGRYYDPLLKMFDHLIHSRFAKPGITDLFEVVQSANMVVNRLDELERAAADPEDAPSRRDHSHLIPSSKS